MRTLRFLSISTLVAGTLMLVGCPAATTSSSGSSTSGAAVTGYQIQPVGASSLTAGVGDTITFGAASGPGIQAIVVETLADGSTASLPTGAVLDYSTNYPTIITRKGYETSNEMNPAGLGVYPLSNAAGLFIEDPLNIAAPTGQLGGRTDGNALHGVLFVTHYGSTSHQFPVHVKISGVAPGGMANTVVTVSGAMPTGNATNGAALFRGTTGHAANCAECHGMNGEGSPAIDSNNDSTLPWTNGIKAWGTADNVAPPLNNTSIGGTPNVAADHHGWNAMVLSFVSRTDTDNTGAWLENPMPQWLTQKLPDGTTLNAQDFADIYAFLEGNTAAPSNGTATGSDTPTQP